MSYRDEFSDFDIGFAYYINEITKIAAGLIEWADQSDGATTDEIVEWYLSQGDLPDGWDDDDTAELRKALEQINASQVRRTI